MGASRTPLVVIDIVGLTPALLGAHTPSINGLAGDGFLATLDGVFPAVTCTAQASMLTGMLPCGPSIVRSVMSASGADRAGGIGLLRLDASVSNVNSFWKH